MCDLLLMRVCSNCTHTAGIDFQSPCLCSVTGEFWTQFSKEFAQAAQENVFFLTDGQADGGAFRNNSFFSTVELPNLRDESVTRLITLIIHEEGKGEVCCMMTLPKYVYASDNPLPNHTFFLHIILVIMAAKFTVYFFVPVVQVTAVPALVLPFRCFEIAS